MPGGDFGDTELADDRGGGDGCRGEVAAAAVAAAERSGEVETAGGRARGGDVRSVHAERGEGGSGPAGETRVEGAGAVPPGLGCERRVAGARGVVDEPLDWDGVERGRPVDGVPAVRGALFVEPGRRAALAEELTVGGGGSCPPSSSSI